MTQPVRPTPEQHKKVCDALRACTTYRDAMAAAGIPWATWCRWRLRVEGEDIENRAAVVAFVREAQRAHSEGRNALVARINLATQGTVKGDWRAALSLLEYQDGSERRRFEARRAKVDLDIARLERAKLQREVNPGVRQGVEVPAILATPREEPDASP